MSNQLNFLELISKASLVVQIIIAILLIFSIASWAIIIFGSRILTKSLKSLSAFEDKFWSGEDLHKMYEGISNRREQLGAGEQIFYVGFKEFIRLQQMSSTSPEAIIQGSSRAMRIAMNREIEGLENQIPFLATVASVSPYIGLFGTVWGIMHAFMSLSNVKQATLQMVAPGIAEALIATAVGLFAAIPAVMAYNRLSLRVAKLEQNYENFIEEFTTLLHRQVFSINR